VRNTLLGLVIAGVLLVLATRCGASRPVAVDRPLTAAAADTGSAAIYARTCSACHGMPEEPGHTLGTKLFEPAYAAARADSTIARLIAQGVPGTSMMGFGPENAKLLSTAQVDAMVRWIRATSGRPN
jgi:mono/diheme cytochrome c family protein